MPVAWKGVGPEVTGWPRRTNDRGLVLLDATTLAQRDIAQDVEGLVSNLHGDNNGLFWRTSGLDEGPDGSLKDAVTVSWFDPRADRVETLRRESGGSQVLLFDNEGQVAGLFGQASGSGPGRALWHTLLPEPKAIGPVDEALPDYSSLSMRITSLTRRDETYVAVVTFPSGQSPLALWNKNPASQPTILYETVFASPVVSRGFVYWVANGDRSAIRRTEPGSVPYATHEYARDAAGREVWSLTRSASELLWLSRAKYGEKPW